MDLALEFLDEHLLDDVYLKLFPDSSNITAETIVSSLSRNNDMRICLSIFTVVTLGGWFFYLSVACFSYFVFFDHEIMKHPKFLKNQVRQEIECALKSVPVISLLTVPWFWGEVKGYSKLYGSPTLYGDLPYTILSIGLFLFVTDCLIYWIHRYLHHPYVYKWLHKPHHKWIVPTPFASHAFHPLDGYLQSVPYHIFVYLVPMQKWLYIAMFIFVNFWTVAIHDALEFLDEHLLDDVYSKLFPDTSNITAETIGSSLPRNNDMRMLLSIFTFLTFCGYFFYLSVSSFSYFVLFDHEIKKHPKFRKNQVRQEIECALKAVPVMSLLTTPWFWGEVKGYSQLYETPTLYGDLPYTILSIGLFLFVTDCMIYWVHRGIHHPYVYKWLHKPHHKFVVPTPFSSYAFHPLDGFLQSLPYHIFVYLVPMQKCLYIAMYIFVNFWVVGIHEAFLTSIGNFLLQSKIVNSSAHHSVHHLYFNYNYGQYFTLWDRLGGSYRQPSDEQYNDVLRKDREIWAKQAHSIDSFENQFILNKEKAM
ncbi:Delta(7)-sterol 5(6)-desaturase erg3B [Pseudolycoriella hygida]|uniref:Delta(7)-sterol 5(6)-desaturase erg3B n=1 Tax=Pseudolycoriella hygida TaxID=35572 RepID=A0A9Q0NBN7_9DIPT|nr:Delta(7)-sterol 5(6)-desaturase erg3B [Pseudolycoriella hygida]